MAMRGLRSAANPYENPAIARWLDSSEGLPPWPAAGESEAERTARGNLRNSCHEKFNQIGALVPGLVLAVMLAYLGAALARWIGRDLLNYERSPVSAILVAIVLGLVVRNTVGLPAVYERGLRVCIRLVLRLGIVLLGLGLSVFAFAKIGVIGVPVVLVSILTGLLAVTWISRMVGLPRRLGTLIAVGTSICGVSAIVATSPVIDATEEETSYAVACVTLFGLIALFCYPFLAVVLFGAENLQQIGTFFGTAIHDTSQVTGAGLVFDQQHPVPAASVSALDAAMVTKLFRNVSMAVVIPMMAVVYHRGGSQGPAKVVLKWHQMVPIFVISFVVMALISTVADMGERPFGLIDAGAWADFKSSVASTAKYCLAIAMAAVGLGTSLTDMRILGVKPLCVGFTAAVLVGVVSFGLIKLLTMWAV